MDQLYDYQRVEKAIYYIKDHLHQQPQLEEIAAHIHLSPYHFQRLFSRWAGVSPKKFLQYLTKEELKGILRKHTSIEEAAFQMGLSSNSRVYDLFVKFEGMTPTAYKSLGEGISIAYGFHESPFGKVLIGLTEWGICHLSFLTEEQSKEGLAELSAQWPNARLEEKQDTSRKVVESIFYHKAHTKGLRVFMKGSPFQLKVWEALLNIEEGVLSDYRSVAKAIGQPGASRAVGSAIGKNHIAYLIPCHRVIRSEGITGSYRWGSERKLAMIGWELSKSATP